MTNGFWHVEHVDPKIPNTMHVWYIYLHLLDFYGVHVGKYTSPMDPMGIVWGPKIPVNVQPKHWRMASGFPQKILGI